MKSNTVGGKYKSLEWNGETLTIRGAIRQTAEGEAEGRILAAWSTLPDGFSFLVGDTTSHSGITWECILVHDKDINGDTTYIDEPGSGGSYTTYWQESNLAAKTLRLSSTGQTFIEAKDGTLSPDYIEFTANKENIGTGTTWSTSPTVTLYDAASGGSAIVQNTTESDTVYLRKADFGSNTSVTVTATAGGKSDEITVVRLIDGSDGITVVNTNQSHTLPSNGDGVVSSYSNSGTTISVYEGTTKLEYDGTGTSNGSWSLSTSQVPNSTLTIGGSDGIDISGKDALVNEHSAMADGTSTVIISYDISGKRVNGNSFTAETTQTITKASNAKTLRLSADTLTFTTAKDGSVSPNFITLVSNRQNTNSTTTWTTSPSVDLYTDATTGTTSVNGDDTVYLRKADFGSNTAVKVTATAGTLSDDVTIVGIAEGSDAITVVNTNQSHTVPATNLGVVTSGDLVGSGTTIKAFEGTTPLTFTTSTPVAGEFSASVTQSPTSTMNTFTIGGNGSNTATVPDFTSMDSGTDSVVLTYTLTVKKENGTTVTIDTTQTITKSKTGEAGSSGTSGESGTSGTSGAQGAPGTPGSPGAGIVYRGVFDGTKAYVHTTERRDVVSDGGSPSPTYYLVDNTSKNGLTTWVDPTTPGQTDWEQFGAQFESVATDILLAQEVYVDQTINIGEENASAVIALNADAPNNENPYISIGQGESQGFLADGMYFGFNAGNPVMSMVSGSTFMFYQSGSIELSDASLVGSGSIVEGAQLKIGRNTANVNNYNFTVTAGGLMSASLAYISGAVEAGEGRIGDWVIDGDTKTLRDEDSEIIFDPGSITGLPEIQMFESGDKKIIIAPRSTLSTTEAASDSITWSSTPSFTSTNVTSNGSNLGTTNIYTVESTDHFQVNAGTFTLGDITVPNLTIRHDDIATSGTGTISYPNYTPSYAGQIHGENDLNNGFYAYSGPAGGQLQAYFYLQVIDGNNGDAVIGSTLLAGAIARGDTDSYSNFVAVESGGQFSVVGNTEITLSDGTTKLAKDVTLDDKILSWDSEKEKWVSAKLSKIHKRNVDEVYKVTVDDKEIEVSDSHGFWLFGNQTNSGQVRVSNIVEGETKIWIKDGDSKKQVIVDKVERIEREEEVITFSVPQYVNYLSNNIISHNYIGGSLYWDEQLIVSSAGGVDGTDSGATVDKNLTISATTTNAKLQYRLYLTAQSSQNINVSSAGVVTLLYTNNTNHFDMTESSGIIDTFFGSSLDSSIQTEYEANFIELTAGGFQVVSNDDRFVRISRRPVTDDATKLLEVSDGHLEVTSRAFMADPANSAYNNTDAQAIFAMGNILPMNPAVATANSIGVTDGIYRPFALGRSGNKWKYLNDVDISGLAESLAGGPVTTTGTTYTNTSTTNYDSYVVLPGGVMLQFGYIYDTSTPREVVFPTQFPTALLSAGCSTLRSSSGGSGFNHVYNLSRNRMTVIIDGSRGFWWAYGK
jgi:hypothetical protein